MKALIVVDMINDFIDGQGSLYVENAGRIVPFVNTHIWLNDGLTMFANDNHLKDDKEFDNFPVHAIKGTWGAQLYGGIVMQLKLLIGHFLVCYFRFYSA